MKKNSLSILLICIIAFAACAGQKKTTNHAGQKNAAIDMQYAQMWRSACFGHCPEYKIEVYKDGLVRYTGIRFVTDSGIYEKNIGTEKAAELLGLFVTYRVDTCKENYENIIPDLPGLGYTLRYNGKQKNIRNASFGPTFLAFIAKQWDSKIRIDTTWEKVSQTYKPD